MGKRKQFHFWLSISNVNDIETKAKTFRYRSFLSEQNQNVLIWSAYSRNKIGTFLFALNC